MRSEFFCKLCVVFVIFFCSVEGIITCTSCGSTCQSSCESTCPNGSVQYSCTQSGGSIHIVCNCVTSGGGGGSGGSGGGDGGTDTSTGLIIFAVVTMICVCGCCVCIIASIFLCIKILLTPGGLCLLIIGLSALNWAFSLVSISGGIKAIWDTFVSQWSLNTVQIVQILIPIVIAVLAHIPHELSMGLALLICLVYIGIQGFFFSKLFVSKSIVPYVTAICTTIGVLAILVTLGLMVVIVLRIQKRMKERREEKNLAAMGLINQSEGTSFQTYGLLEPYSPGFASAPSSSGFGGDRSAYNYPPPPAQVYSPPEYGNPYGYSTQPGYAPVPTQEPEAENNKEIL